MLPDTSPKQMELGGITLLIFVFFLCVVVACSFFIASLLKAHPLGYYGTAAMAAGIIFWTSISFNDRGLPAFLERLVLLMRRSTLLPYQRDQIEHLLSTSQGQIDCDVFHLFFSAQPGLPSGYCAAMVIHRLLRRDDFIGSTGATQQRLELIEERAREAFLIAFNTAPPAGHGARKSRL